MGNENSKLPEVLKALMETETMSIRKLSELSQVPTTNISRLLSGGSVQDPMQLIRIAKCLGTSVEYLVTGADSRPPSMEETLTEHLFSGWVKVTLEKAIPDKRKTDKE